MLFSWEITPREEKEFNKALIPFIAVIVVFSFVRLFFSGVALADLSIWTTLVIVISFAVLVWIFVYVIRRGQRKKGEKFILTTKGVRKSIEGVEKSFAWKDFRGFFMSPWYGGILFELVLKRSILPFFSTVKMRGESDNSELIREILSQFLPEERESYDGRN